MPRQNRGFARVAPQQLRIGIIAPPWFAVPPNGYGGIEWVVSILCDGLAERGHEVTLFASGGSESRARICSLFRSAPSELLGDWMIEAAHVADAYGHWSDFDVIHDHTQVGLLRGAGLRVPVVHTVHNEVLPRLGAYYARLPQSLHYVCVSGHQASTMPDGLATTVIHNAVDPARFDFSASPGSYLLFVGRMSPDKGILDAVEIARRSGKPLLVLAKINEQRERDYFRDVVAPAMTGMDVEVRQQVDHAEKVVAYRDALATLFPIHWPEPFGLVMAESMATGTPVIAYRRGAVPEVVDDGRTGFICSSLPEAADSVSRVTTLNRADCRSRVENCFASAQNVERHEALYRELMA